MHRHRGHLDASLDVLFIKGSVCDAVLNSSSSKRSSLFRLRHYRDAWLVSFHLAHTQATARSHESVGGTRDVSKSCNLIGYAGIPATENKWLIGNAPGPLPARVRSHVSAYNLAALLAREQEAEPQKHTARIHRPTYSSNNAF